MPAVVARCVAVGMAGRRMPTPGLRGSGLPPRVPECSPGARAGKALVVDNPWAPGEPVVLVPALEPDVSIVHVQRADRMGNLVIEGFSTHEPEMIRASRRVIASCEELVSTDEIRAHPEQTSIPFLHVSAVVVQRFGAYPTSVHRYYDYDAAQVSAYQAAARAGAPAVAEYLNERVWGCAGFDDHLARTAGPDTLEGLRQAMQAIV